MVSCATALFVPCLLLRGRSSQQLLFNLTAVPVGLSATPPAKHKPVYSYIPLCSILRMSRSEMVSEVLNSEKNILIIEQVSDCPGTFGRHHASRQQGRLCQSRHYIHL